MLYHGHAGGEVPHVERDGAAVVSKDVASDATVPSGTANSDNAKQAP